MLDWTAQVTAGRTGRSRCNRPVPANAAILGAEPTSSLVSPTTSMTTVRCAISGAEDTSMRESRDDETAQCRHGKDGLVQQRQVEAVD